MLHKHICFNHLKSILMRHLKIQVPQNNLPSLGILTQIDELTKHDMVYIYHHLQIGSELTLERDYARLWDKTAVVVLFKGFKIGYISKKSSGIISKQIDKGHQVIAKIKTLYKQKYMPLDGLDVAVTIQ